MSNCGGNRIKIIAHRGASYYEPENTLRAYKKAIKMGADFVETDIRQCKDGKLVVMHDADVKRTTNGKGLVNDLTLKEIKALDAGKKEMVPTLDEVIKLVKNKVGLVIEIKEPGTENKILERIEKNNIENAILTSFYHKTVKNVKKINLEIDTGIIFVGEPVNVYKLASDSDSDIIFPSYRYMTSYLVKSAKKHDLTIYPWTIDDRHIFEKFKMMEVDGIITNKLIQK